MTTTPARARTVRGSGIPVVSIGQASFAERLSAACAQIGFVAIAGHGIPQRQLGAMRDLVKRVFDTDEASKSRQAITRDNYRGYIPFGFFTPNRSGDTLAPAPAPDADAYEGYKLHWECPPVHPARAQCVLYGANRWAEHVPEMADLIHAYWAECDRIGALLLDAFAAALGLDAERLKRQFEAPLTNMTLLHYPPRQAQGFGIHPHKDTCAFTILHPDPLGGLELRTRAGEWIQAECPPDALLVNIGEMMELWSGGRLLATPHRAVNRSAASRYSFPYFAVPNHAVVVEPLLEPVAGFSRAPMPVGHVSAEVWRTNWPDQCPSAAGYDLGQVQDP